MPYIKQSERLRAAKLPETPGELNYAITMMIMDYLANDNEPNAPLSYTYKGLNEVIGVLECVKQEAYRRLVVPLEIQKCKQNGDVY